MNSSAAQKVQLRRQLRSARAALSKSARRSKSQRAAQLLVRTSALRCARHVAVYLDSGREMQTGVLIKALHRSGKRVSVPAIDRRIEGRMNLVRLEKNGALVVKRFGIRAPVHARYTSHRVDAVILPLIGFDSRGHRLGNGGGYYDRWLAQRRPRPFCIGYAFALQGIATIPTEQWDQRLDAVCTERGVKTFPKR